MKPTGGPPPSPQGGGKRIARNAFVRAGGEVLAKLASLAFYIVLARELGTNSFGDFMFALSLTTVLTTAAGFGTDNLLAREVAREPGRVHHFLTNLVAIKLVGTSALVLLAVGIVTVAGKPPAAVLAVAIVGAGVAVENITKTWYSAFQAFERMSLISASLIVNRTVTAAIGIAVLLLGGGLIAVSFIYLLGSLLGAAVAIWALRRHVVVPRREIDRSRWMELIKAGIPIGIAAFLFSVLLKVDASLLGFLGGQNASEEVGVYSAAFRIVEATMFLSWSFGAAALPWLARHDRQAAVPLSHGYELGVKVITVVFLPLGLALVFFSGGIIDLLYGDAYGGAELPLSLLGVTTALYGINHFTATLLTARDQPQRFARAAGVVAVVNVIMNLVLIPEYGADGAAFSAAVSGLLLGALSISQAQAAAGRVRLRRALGTPVVAGLAMSALLLVASPPFPIGMVAGVALFAVVAIGFERLVYPDDFAIVIGIVRRRRRGAAVEPPPPGAPPVEVGA
jgi:O-antigen/teichoic acid export membrane protein